MNDSQDRLREMLARRADRVHSHLTISDIRDAGLRGHRHSQRLIAPLLVAAAVVIVAVAVALGGRQTAPTIAPGGPGATSNSSAVKHSGLTTPGSPTVARPTASATVPASAPRARVPVAQTTIATTGTLTSTVSAGP